MKILIASSEIVPFAKTGGLADVTGALPRELEKLGHEVTVFMPAYQTVVNAGIEIEPVGVTLEIPLGIKLASGELLRGKLPDSDVNVYFVKQDDYFDRPQLYGEDGADYADNCERFVFFCRAILESIRLLDLETDLIHVNDWQAGLIPALLKIEYAGMLGYENISSLMTIHNLAYQGSFWHWDMLLTGLDWKYFNWQQMEFHGRLNLMKTGIVFADSINTVSPTYAHEIQTEEHGCGLEGVLRYRSDVLSGILNGIDKTEWDPSTDKLISVNYDANCWPKGKEACKASLQDEMGLAKFPKIPLIGIVGRLASQKGWSLILPVMQQWLQEHSAQWVILGTGQPEYHEALLELQQAFPDKLAVELGFSNELAHRIEAGADLFLMPSEYEPCGLNQQYSLAYGTIPVVRSTGGLADTVVQANENTIINGTANGFRFDDFTADALHAALSAAINMYENDFDSWGQLVKAGMNQDWSWAAGARKYERLYQQTVARNRKPQSTC